MKQPASSIFKIKMGVAVAGLFMAPLALAMLDTHLNAGRSIKLPTKNNSSILSPITTPTPNQSNQITSTSEAETPTQPANGATASNDQAPTPTSSPSDSKHQPKPSDANYANGNENKNSQPDNAVLGISVPAGATALCNDGAFSYKSLNTCAHHNGVKHWL